MAENKFKAVADLLEIPLDEEFRVSDNSDGVYKITEEEGLCFRMNSGTNWVTHCGGMLDNLLRGSRTIIRLPYRPKKGDLFWTYRFTEWVVSSSDWIGDPWDYALLGAGMIFRTQEEALAARAELYKKVTGKEYNSNDYR